MPCGAYSAHPRQVHDKERGRGRGLPQQRRSWLVNCSQLQRLVHCSSQMQETKSFTKPALLANCIVRNFKDKIAPLFGQIKKSHRGYTKISGMMSGMSQHL